MAVIQIICPDCNSDNVIKNGKEEGIQRYRCLNEPCVNQFRYEYKYGAYKKGVIELAYSMHENGSSIRDIARVLKIAATTVSRHLKKKREMSQPKSTLTS